MVDLDKLDKKIAAGLRSEHARPFLTPYIVSRISQLASDQEAEINRSAAPDKDKLMMIAARMDEVRLIERTMDRADQQRETAQREFNALNGR